MPAPSAPALLSVGELLWDEFLLPAGNIHRTLGGSPANVAATARRLGAHAAVASCVGRDNFGADAIAHLARLGLPLGPVAQHAALPTGRVAVTAAETGHPRYEIVTPAAWDRLRVTEAALDRAERADVLCWSSLGQRDPFSRAATRLLLEAASPEAWRVFDCNLRAPFWDAARLEEGFALAHAVKISLEELPAVAEACGLPSAPEACARALLQRWRLELVAVTLGAEGCLLVVRDGAHRAPAPSIQVVDTVGAGDAFTAALALGLACGAPLSDIAATANAVAAHVCAHAGAIAPPSAELRARVAAWASGRAAPSGKRFPLLAEIDRADLRGAIVAGDRLEAASGLAAADPARPRFHFAPPGGWLNDPNAPFWHAGWWHVFYQKNPYAAHWPWLGVHWGHARSRDLLRWEHCPVAFAPSFERGEVSCWSGCALPSAAGEPPGILYTSLDAAGPADPEQWIAEPWDPRDETLSFWRRPADPVALRRSDHPDGFLPEEWRDPFCFEAFGRRLMVIGGKRAEAAGGEPVVFLYEEAAGVAPRWRYRGEFYARPGPNPNRAAAECPNVVVFGERAVLFYSPYANIECVVGRLDPATLAFTPEWRGHLWATDAFYASNIALRPGVAPLVIGWLRFPMCGDGFDPARGWAGCLALPRELGLDASGRPFLRPSPEMAALRGEILHERDETPLGAEPLQLAAGHRGGLEAHVALRRGGATACGLRLAGPHAGDQVLEIRWDAEGVRAGAQTFFSAAEAPGPDQDLDLVLHLDRGVAELATADGRRVAVGLHPVDPVRSVLHAFAEGAGATLLRARAWALA